MPDDPLEREFEIVRKLKLLSERFRTGYRKQHPISEKHREAVHKAIGKDWEQKQKERQQSKGEAKAQSQKQQEEEQKKQQSKDHGHSH